MHIFVLNSKSMQEDLIKESGFSYIEKGEGKPIIILHGLMGGLSNFQGVFEYFSSKKYKVIIPELPVENTPILKTNVATFSKFVKDFIDFKNLKDVILLGNSLGGHVGLLFTRDFPELVSGLIITGSSGLYEKSMMGDGYPKRGNYEYIQNKTEEVFYDPKIATKEIVDEVFAGVNDREKLFKTLSLAKSAIRHNMTDDLPKMDTNTLIIWGKQDIVTPPNVAEEFNSLLPNSELSWIDKCGHAPMMEHPKDFNIIMENWLSKNNL
jgi:2-hydroxy-6-oxonona-2,4-dienedioate hydrolase